MEEISPDFSKIRKIRAEGRNLGKTSEITRVVLIANKPAIRIAAYSITTTPTPRLSSNQNPPRASPHKTESAAVQHLKYFEPFNTLSRLDTSRARNRSFAYSELPGFIEPAAVPRPISRISWRDSRTARSPPVVYE